MEISGVSREGVTEVLRALRHQIAADKKAAEPLVEDAPWQP